MPRNEADRAKYAVIRTRYASDLSDAEFAIIEPLLPAPKRRGREPTKTREIVNALFYLVRTGGPWRYLPQHFPPFTTVQNLFYAWRDSGLWDLILAVLAMAVREAEGKNPAPTVVIVDSRSVKATEAGGPRGFDAGKRVKGRERHIAVDTLGLLIEHHVTTANVQDRDVLPASLQAVGRRSPWMQRAFVDGGYAGDKTARAAFAASRSRLDVVKRTDTGTKGFILLPKRWIVERSFGWVNRARRLAKDFEAPHRKRTRLVLARDRPPPYPPDRPRLHSTTMIPGQALSIREIQCETSIPGRLLKKSQAGRRRVTNEFSAVGL